MFVIANARKLMRQSPGAERNTRTGKHARFLPTVHSDACTGCGKCEKVCVLEQPAIKVLPLSLAKGELGHHYRFGWLEEQWQIVNVTPGARRWRKRLVAQPPLAGVTSPLSVLRAGDVFERSVVWCVDLARQLQQ